MSRIYEHFVSDKCTNDTSVSLIHISRLYLSKNIGPLIGERNDIGEDINL